MTAKNWQLEQDVDDYMYQFLETIGSPKNDFVNDRTLYKKACNKRHMISLFNKKG